MAGLFGLDEDASLGLLTAALAAMSARGVRPGTALAQGGLLGINAMQGAKQGRADAARQQREDEYRQMQMDDYRRKIQEQQEQKQALSSAFQGAMIPGQQAQPPVEFGGGEGTRPGMPAQAPGFDYGKFAQMIGPSDPGMAMQALGKLTPSAQESPYAKINPKDFTLESLRVFSRTKDPADLVAREEPKAPDNPLGKVGPSDFTPASVQAFIAGGGKDYSVLKPIDKRSISSTTVNNFPKLPDGYMWKDPTNPRQGVEPLPDSPQAKAAERLRAGEVQTGNIVLTKVDQARQIVKSSSIPTTGFVGSMTARVPGTPGYDLARVVDTIRANVGFDALNQMRAQSPTGGALGQVSERENQYLQAKIASLEQAQTQKQFLRALDEVEQAFNVVVHGSQKGAGVIRGSGAGGGGGRIKFSDLPE